MAKALDDVHITVYAMPHGESYTRPMNWYPVGYLFAPGHAIPQDCAGYAIAYVTVHRLLPHSVKKAYYNIFRRRLVDTCL